MQLMSGHSRVSALMATIFLLFNNPLPSAPLTSPSGVDPCVLLCVIFIFKAAGSELYD